jgi:hypothetical protein
MTLVHTLPQLGDGKAERGAMGRAEAVKATADTSPPSMQRKQSADLLDVDQVIGSHLRLSKIR